MTDIVARDSIASEKPVHWTISVLVVLFMLVCVFDPANVLTQAKVPLFVALWLATALNIAVTKSEVKLPVELLTYSLAFVAIPLLSIVWYNFSDGGEPFEGFALFKGYVLILFAAALVLNRIDAVPVLCAVLTGMAVLAIAVFVYLELDPGIYFNLKRLTDPSGTLILDRRRYGAHLELLQVYFVTSPMLLLSAAYYFHRAVTADRQRLALWSLVVINVVGMVAGGTRNNILGAVLLLFCLWPLYTRKPARNALVSVVLLLILALPFLTQLRGFFDVNEPSNHLKLELLRDYKQMFLDDPRTLFIGQGLGAYQSWGSRGVKFYISELTYLEMIRNFGLFGAAAMMTLLLIPVTFAFTAGAKRDRALAVSYAIYLVMCLTNPNLFSSMGILILSVLLAGAAMNREESLAQVSSGG
ncbi:hypothetical protein [Bradyrhizobium sp.]|jgi:hypothetical protein|uniref:hypothetical protein n=1 Tax=Bradyrhizobium sp. TaxID=376 RepID=UPI002DDDB7D7|nr:hypothetical protein [Bradyrhizobium sp.]HEV2154834.1 hypothetical protein [Bradyrhizobium sp.]